MSVMGQDDHNASLWDIEGQRADLAGPVARLSVSLESNSRPKPSHNTPEVLPPLAPTASPIGSAVPWADGRAPDWPARELPQAPAQAPGLAGCSTPEAPPFPVPATASAPQPRGTPGASAVSMSNGPTGGLPGRVGSVPAGSSTQSVPIGPMGKTSPRDHQPLGGPTAGMDELTPRPEDGLLAPLSGRANGSSGSPDPSGPEKQLQGLPAQGLATSTGSVGGPFGQVAHPQTPTCGPVLPGGDVQPTGQLPAQGRPREFPETVSSRLPLPADVSDDSRLDVGQPPNLSPVADKRAGTQPPFSSPHRPVVDPGSDGEVPVDTIRFGIPQEGTGHASALPAHPLPGPTGGTSDPAEEIRRHLPPHLRDAVLGPGDGVEATAPRLSPSGPQPTSKADGEMRALPDSAPHFKDEAVFGSRSGPKGGPRRPMASANGLPGHEDGAVSSLASLPPELPPGPAAPSSRAPAAQQTRPSAAAEPLISPAGTLEEQPPGGPVLNSAAGPSGAGSPYDGLVAPTREDNRVGLPEGQLQEATVQDNDLGRPGGVTLLQPEMAEGSASWPRPFSGSLQPSGSGSSGHRGSASAHQPEAEDPMAGDSCPQADLSLGALDSEIGRLDGLLRGLQQEVDPSRLPGDKTGGPLASSPASDSPRTPPRRSVVTAASMSPSRIPRLPAHITPSRLGERPEWSPGASSIPRLYPGSPSGDPSQQQEGLSRHGSVRDTQQEDPGLHDLMELGSPGDPGHCQSSAAQPQDGRPGEPRPEDHHRPGDEGLGLTPGPPPPAEEDSISGDLLDTSLQASQRPPGALLGSKDVPGFTLRGNPAGIPLDEWLADDGEGLPPAPLDCPAHAMSLPAGYLAPTNVPPAYAELLSGPSGLPLPPEENAHLPEWMRPRHAVPRVDSMPVEPSSGHDGPEESGGGCSHPAWPVLRWPAGPGTTAADSPDSQPSAADDGSTRRALTGTARDEQPNPSSRPAAGAGRHSPQHLPDGPEAQLGPTSATRHGAAVAPAERKTVQTGSVSMGPMVAVPYLDPDVQGLPVVSVLGGRQLLLPAGGRRPAVAPVPQAYGSRQGRPTVPLPDVKTHLRPPQDSQSSGGATGVTPRGDSQAPRTLLPQSSVSLTDTSPGRHGHWPSTALHAADVNPMFEQRGGHPGHSDSDDGASSDYSLPEHINDSSHLSDHHPYPAVVGDRSSGGRGSQGQSRPPEPWRAASISSSSEGDDCLSDVGPASQDGTDSSDDDDGWQLSDALTPGLPHNGPAAATASSSDGRRPSHRHTTEPRPTSQDDAPANGASGGETLLPPGADDGQPSGLPGPSGPSRVHSSGRRTGPGLSRFGQDHQSRAPPGDESPEEEVSRPPGVVAGGARPSLLITRPDTDSDDDETSPGSSTSEVHLDPQVVGSTAQHTAGSNRPEAAEAPGFPWPTPRAHGENPGGLPVKAVTVAAEAPESRQRADTGPGPSSAPFTTDADADTDSSEDEPTPQAGSRRVLPASTAVSTGCYQPAPTADALVSPRVGPFFLAGSGTPVWGHRLDLQQRAPPQDGQPGPDAKAGLPLRSDASGRGPDLPDERSRHQAGSGSTGGGLLLGSPEMGSPTRGALSGGPVAFPTGRGPGELIESSHKETGRGPKPGPGNLRHQRQGSNGLAGHEKEPSAEDLAQLRQQKRKDIMLTGTVDSDDSDDSDEEDHSAVSRDAPASYDQQQHRPSMHSGAARASQRASDYTDDGNGSDSSDGSSSSHDRPGPSSRATEPDRDTGASRRQSSGDNAGDQQPHRALHAAGQSPPSPPMLSLTAASSPETLGGMEGNSSGRWDSQPRLDDSDSDESTEEETVGRGPWPARGPGRPAGGASEPRSSGRAADLTGPGDYGSTSDSDDEGHWGHPAVSRSHPDGPGRRGDLASSRPSANPTAGQDPAEGSGVGGPRRPSGDLLLRTGQRPSLPDIDGLGSRPEGAFSGPPSMPGHRDSEAGQPEDATMGGTVSARGHWPAQAGDSESHEAPWLARQPAGPQPSHGQGSDLWASSDQRPWRLGPTGEGQQSPDHRLETQRPAPSSAGEPRLQQQRAPEAQTSSGRWHPAELRASQQPWRLKQRTSRDGRQAPQADREPVFPWSGQSSPGASAPDSDTSSPLWSPTGQRRAAVRPAEPSDSDSSSDSEEERFRFSGGPATRARSPDLVGVRSSVQSDLGGLFADAGSSPCSEQVAPSPRAEPSGLTGMAGRSVRGSDRARGDEPAEFSFAVTPGSSGSSSDGEARGMPGPDGPEGQQRQMATGDWTAPDHSSSSPEGEDEPGTPVPSMAGPFPGAQCPLGAGDSDSSGSPSDGENSSTDDDRHGSRGSAGRALPSQAAPDVSPQSAAGGWEAAGGIGEGTDDEEPLAQAITKRRCVPAGMSRALRGPEEAMTPERSALSRWKSPPRAQQTAGTGTVAVRSSSPRLVWNPSAASFEPAGAAGGPKRSRDPRDGRGVSGASGGASSDASDDGSSVRLLTGDMGTRDGHDIIWPAVADCRPGRGRQGGEQRLALARPHPARGDQCPGPGFPGQLMPQSIARAILGASGGLSREDLLGFVLPAAEAESEEDDRGSGQPLLWPAEPRAHGHPRHRGRRHGRRSPDWRIGPHPGLLAVLESLRAKAVRRAKHHAFMMWAHQAGVLPIDLSAPAWPEGPEEPSSRASPGLLLQMAFKPWHMLTVARRSREEQLALLRRRVTHRALWLSLGQWATAVAGLRLQRQGRVGLGPSTVLVGRAPGVSHRETQSRLRRETDQLGDKAYSEARVRAAKEERTREARHEQRQLCRERSAVAMASRLARKRGLQAVLAWRSVVDGEQAARGWEALAREARESHVPEPNPCSRESHVPEPNPCWDRSGLSQLAQIVGGLSTSQLHSLLEGLSAEDRATVHKQLGILSQSAPAAPPPDSGSRAGGGSFCRAHEAYRNA